ncbi:MAG TPA: hypothetical protein DEP66_05065 [Acidimicrobiaceae bacterium]|nr:hypothetical protein [Acidimicrobiaceae bacterium]
MSTDTAAADTFRPRTLSPSAAGTFRNCPRRWKFHYVDDLPDPPGEPAVLGSFVHKVLEDLLELPAPDRTIERAREVCTRNWPETANSDNFADLDFDDDQSRAFKAKAWAFVEGYFAMFDPQQVDVVEREHKVRATVGEVPFFGFIDLLENADGGLRVTDYKTGKPPRPRYLDEALSQIWLYAAALADQGTEVATVQLAYIGNGADRRGKTFVREMDADAMAAAVDRHGETWRAIHDALDRDEFKPKPGPLCGWCAYRDHCPEGAAEYRRRNGEE